MTKPSAIIAQYRDGTLTRTQAADALRGAEWDDEYTRASMAPGGDYDGSDFPEEGFSAQVYVPVSAGELTEADYEAFQAAFGQWKAAQHT